MARIKDTTVEAVKQAADFVDVVEERTPLRKAAARYTGRCPFHEERTPSFSVNPVEGLYHCFGCGKGGDMITFVRETQGLDFVGAIEWLADRFHIPLEYEEASPEARTRAGARERLYALLEQAAAFYERYLWDSPAGSLARDYLAGRGLGEEVCREFRLGLALGGETLARKAREKGFTRDELRAAGLAQPRGDDYFQRRLLFPLADARGRVRRLPGAQAARGRPAARRSTSTRPSPSSSTRAQSSTGSTRRARRSRSEDRACRRRGEHRRDRAAAGRASSRSSRAWAPRSPSSSCASSGG